MQFANQLQHLVDPQTQFAREWRNFVDGKNLEPSLLLLLLRYKYQRSQQIEISREVFHVYSGQEELTLYQQLLERTLPLQHLIISLVVHHYQSEPITTVVVASSTKSLFDAQPVTTLYVLTVLEKHEVAFHGNIEAIQFIFNNHYGYHIDNGYFTFLFMRFLLEALSKEQALVVQEGGEKGATLFETDGELENPRTLASNIVYELMQFDVLQENLLTLYNEISTLLDRIHKAERGRRALNTDELRRRVETAKQRLYTWIECALYVESCEQQPLMRSLIHEPVRLADHFLAIPVPSLTDQKDPIPTGTMTPNQLFNEMLSMLKFFQTVVVATHEHELTSPVRFRIVFDTSGSETTKEYTITEVKQHILHLRGRLLQHIDSLNVPLILSPFLQKTLGFTQQDYDALMSRGLLTFPLILHHLTQTRSLSSRSLLVSPGESALIMTNKSVELAQQLKQQSEQKLSFFFIEEEEDEPEKASSQGNGGSGLYYTLLMVDRISVRCQTSLYTASIDLEEMRKNMQTASTLMKTLTLTCFRTQLESHIEAATRDYVYTSWYSLLVITRLNALLEKPPPPPVDWLKAMKDALASISSQEVALIIRVVIREIQVAILEAYLSPIAIIEEQEEEEATVPKATIGGKSLDISSSLGDLAKLAMEDEFIDDNVIADLIALMPKKPDCYIFDATYWGNSIAGEKPLKQAPHRIFTKTASAGGLILMPINQEEYHWALAIIDVTSPTPTVQYYSSLAEDAYYGTPFRQKMLAFLAIQTPTIKNYTIQRITGPLQLCSSVDCALFVVQKIATLCGTQPDVKYSRLFAIQQILNTIQESPLSISVKLHALALQVYQFFIQIPEVWQSIVSNKKRVATYRLHFLRLLSVLLTRLDLYTKESITNLLNVLKGKPLNSYQNVQDVELLFDNTLAVLKTQKTRPSPSKPQEPPPAQQKPKQPRDTHPEVVETEKEESIRETLLDKFMARLEQMIATVEEEVESGNIADKHAQFVGSYTSEISDFLEPLIDNEKHLDQLINEIGVEIYGVSATPFDIHHLRSIIEHYLSLYGTPASKKRAKKLVLQCFHCGAETEQVDLLLMLPYCSNLCREQQ